MAKKSKKPATAAKDPQRKANTARAGLALGAAVLAALTWLTGGFTRESAVEWTRIVVIAVALALLIRWPIAEPFKIPSGSMEPTLHGDPRFMRGDRVFVNKWVFGVRYPFMNKRIWRGADPQRFDVVVFKSVEKNPSAKTLVKRIVGLPGERVHIANGKVHINGVPLELPPSMPPVQYTSWGMYGVLEDEAHAVVPDDCYLLLGDNSGASRDGRVFGWVPNKNLVGRAFCIWWPHSRWHDFTGFSRTWWWRGLVGLLGLLLFVRLFLGRFWRVHTDAVSDTLRKGEHIFVNKCAYGLSVPFTGLRLSRGRGPRRGEVVLYHHRPAEGHPDGVVLLGRVAGLPGEQVHLNDGRLEVNGRPVENPASLASRRFESDKETGRFGRSKGKEHAHVPEGHVFILADDADGLDSRTLGWIPRDGLVGPAAFVWWPVTRWRRVRN